MQFLVFILLLSLITIIPYFTGWIFIKNKWIEEQGIPVYATGLLIDVFFVTGIIVCILLWAVAGKIIS